MIGLLDYPSGRVAWDIRRAVSERPPPPPAAQGAPGQAAPDAPRPDRRGGPRRGRGRRRPRIGARGQRGRGQPAGRRAEGDPARGEHAHLRQERRGARDHRGRHQPHRRPGRGDPQGPEGRHRRGRGQALLRARRRRLLPPGGAVVHDLETGSATQGGSTITMQLVKNLYSPRADRREASSRRPIAFQYEKRYTKNQILARLNRRLLRPERDRRAGRLADLLRQGRPEITLPQAALLAGLPQAPTAYNPFENPAEARARRVVLEEMAPAGSSRPRWPRRPRRRASTSSVARPTSASARSTSSSTSARS